MTAARLTAARLTAASLAALALATLGHGALVLAQADWQACLANSLDGLSGDPPGLPRLAEAGWSHWLGLFLGSVTGWLSGVSPGAAFLFLGLTGLPPLLLSLPAFTANRPATRRAFQVALLGYALCILVLLLPPEAMHDCDRKGVASEVILLAPFLALAWAWVAFTLCALVGCKGQA